MTCELHVNSVNNQTNMFKGDNFRIMFVCYVYVMCMFCISPEVTLCGWRGYKYKGLQ